MRKEAWDCDEDLEAPHNLGVAKTAQTLVRGSLGLGDQAQISTLLGYVQVEKNSYRGLFVQQGPCGESESSPSYSVSRSLERSRDPVRHTEHHLRTKTAHDSL
jgi:hypothetical protein